MRRIGLISALAIASSIALATPVFAGDWVANGSNWEYHENGNPTASRWVQGANSQTWYYIKANCKMASGEWIQSNGAWYYMNSNGAMAVNQWVQTGGDWYYMNGNGVMVTNQTIEGYEIGSDGKMLTNNSNRSNNTANTAAYSSDTAIDLHNLIGTYSGYILGGGMIGIENTTGLSGSKIDATLNIYEDLGEIYGAITYEDSNADDRTNVYLLKNADDGKSIYFSFAHGDGSLMKSFFTYSSYTVTIKNGLLKTDFNSTDNQFAFEIKK